MIITQMRERPTNARPTAIRVAVLAAGLAGCVSLPPAQQQPVDADLDACAAVDLDADGYVNCGTPRFDCDDGDTAIHPGALEVCGDGIDQDCRDGDLPCAQALAGNTIGAAGDRWTVNNAALAITFDRGVTADGVTGAIELRDLAGSGAQLMMDDPLPSDRLTGVTRFPTTASWRAVGQPPSFSELAVGPAVVRIVQRWNDGGDTGSSEYTIYPDGRIHRHDEVEVAPSSDQYLVAFITLDPAALNYADWQGSPAPEPFDIVGVAYEPHYEAPPTGAASYVCAFHATTGDRIGLAARIPGGADGLRVSESIRSGVEVAALVLDWVRLRAVASGMYRADLMFHVGHGSELRPCVAVGPYADAFLQPPTLAVTAPAALRLDAPEDADDDGYLERVGAYAVDANGALQVTMSPTAGLPSLAVVISEVDGSHDPVLLRDGVILVRGRDYHLQVEGGDVWVVLAAPVGAGAALRLEWP